MVRTLVSHAMRWIGLALMLAGLVGLPAPAAAQEGGTPVTVRVVDPEGVPIPTAAVRHPSEAERHRVNTITGEWKASTLYLPTGETIVFKKGMDVNFEISAPGYKNADIHYLVRKRKNLIIVTLQPMEELLEPDDDPGSVQVQFARDKPIDGSTSSDPAQ